MNSSARKVLIVDDSSEDQELYHRYLRRDQGYSYNFLQARLGQQGLELWHLHQPDVVLLDYKLPDLDGLEFLEQLKNEHPKLCLPIIIVTGQGNEEVAVQAMKAGAQDYLVKKQITPDRLQLTVKKVIETVRLGNELQQHIERKRLVSQITQKIHQTLELSEILQTTVREVRQFLETDRVLIYQLQSKGWGQVTTESVGASWTPLLSTSYHDPCFDEKYFEAFRQGLITLKADIHDGSIAPCHVELLTKLQVRANLVVPILQNGRLWGMLIAHHCTAPRQWQPLEVELLQELATHVGIALQQAEVYQQAHNELIERRRIETQLRESEERLRLALIASRMGTWDWNIQTGLITWSENLEALFGLEPGEFDGSFEMFVDTLHPDDRDRVLAAIDHAIATGDDYEIEFRVVYPNGNIRWALSQGKVFYDQNHQPIRMAGNDIDITERKQRELNKQFINQLDLRLRHLQDAQTMMWETLSSLGQYLEVNRCSLGKIDWQPGLYITEREWCRDVASSDLMYQLSDFATSDFQAVFAANQAAVVHDITTDSRTLAFASNYAHIQVNAFVVVPCIYQGQLATVLTISSKTPRVWRADEITLLQETVARIWSLIEQTRAMQALRASEERFRTSVENILDCLGIYSAMRNEQGQIIDFRTEYVNHAACLNNEMTYEQQIGKGLCELLPKHRESGLFDEYCRVVETGQPLVKENLIYTDEYGQQRLTRAFDIRVAKFGDGFVATWRDITERKQTEEALRQNEQLLRLALAGAQAGSWDWEIPSGKILWSPENFDLYGIDPIHGSLQYEDWYNALHPDDRERANTEVLQLIAERRPEFRTEFRIVHPQRGVRWLLTLGRLTLNDQGEPIRLSGINLDTSDRKQAEKALRYSEERFRTLANNMSQFAWIADETGWIFWYNQRWFDYTGTTLEEMQGWGWQKVHHPDHVERVVQHIRHCFETGQSWEDTFPLRGQDGQYRWFLSRAIPIRDENHKIVCWFGTNTDIEQQKQAEEKLRQSEERYRCLAELIPQLVWTADAQGALLDVNQRWTDFTGVTLEQAHTTGWEQVVHPEDIPILTQQWADAVRRGVSYQAEGRMRRADGVYCWYLHQAIPQKNEQGQIVKWFGTATEIEAQKQMEAERDRLLAQEQAARAEAERANRIKDEFLAVLSHELRSPLNPILGWAKLMQTRKFDPAKTTEALATIERNAKLQCQLIDDLLDVAKILRGKLNMDEAPVNLVLVIEAALDTVRTAAVAKSILLHPVLPQIGQVSGDSARLQQIIWNLLSNAIKFTPVGGRVDIRLERVENQAQISISDTGKGINPDFLPYIFESFRQEDASTTRKYGGLGLGLAIVRHLVEAHGGTIQADSQGEGQGATFIVRLPLLDHAQQYEQPDQLPAQEPDLTGIRVLVVDDEPDARELLSTMLVLYDAEVLTVTRPAEVLAALESFQPHVLVSDIGMPEMDGYTLLQQIRSLPPQSGGLIPAIALTAYARAEDQQRALAAGFQYHISKPIDLDQLAQAISALFLHK